MSYNDSTTIGEILRISSNVLNENDVFKHGKRNLAKIFLRELLGFNANPSDDELESSYKKCSPREDIPTNSEEFWNFIENGRVSCYTRDDFGIWRSSIMPKVALIMGSKRLEERF